jgi:hypothetical protein
MKTTGLNQIFHLLFHRNGSSLASQGQFCTRAIRYCDRSPPLLYSEKTTAIQSFISPLLIYNYEKVYQHLQI